MSLLAMQLQKELRTLINGYAKDANIVKVDKFSDGTRRFVILPKKEKYSKSGQDLAKEITPEYLSFLEVFIKFVKSSKHIEILQLSDLFISCVVNELLNYWVKNYISFCVHHFKQEIIDGICQQFKAFIDIYGKL
jgi:hypothetical protein